MNELPHMRSATLTLDLTGIHMRRNITYILSVERPHGQTKQARSENAGLEAHGDPQPAPRRGVRLAVQGASILRSQGSAPGPLRNAAPTQRRERVDCRCGDHVWCVAPHRL